MYQGVRSLGYMWICASQCEISEPVQVCVQRVKSLRRFVVSISMNDITELFGICLMVGVSDILETACTRP